MPSKHQPFKREELGELFPNFDTVCDVSFFELPTVKSLVRSRSIRLVGGSAGFSTVLNYRISTASA